MYLCLNLFFLVYCNGLLLISSPWFIDIVVLFFNLTSFFFNFANKLCKKYYIFKTGYAKLLIETGRWFSIPRDNRICKLCACSELGDEFHYIFKGTDVCISNSRVVDIPKYFISNPNVVEFETLLNVQDHKQKPTY